MAWRCCRISSYTLNIYLLVEAPFVTPRFVQCLLWIRMAAGVWRSRRGSGVRDELVTRQPLTAKGRVCLGEMRRLGVNATSANPCTRQRFVLTRVSQAKLWLQ